jgi:hypothetical protein
MQYTYILVHQMCDQSVSINIKITTNNQEIYYMTERNPFNQYSYMPYTSFGAPNA